MSQSKGPENDDLAGAVAAIGRGVLEALPDKRGALLPILHAVQAARGYIPADAVPVIAQTLNLTRAEVHGVVTFYHDFRTEPAGRRLVQICQAESCQAMGSGILTAAAKKRLGVDFDQTTADGEFTLKPVYCLGNCAASPSVMVHGKIHGRVTPEGLSRILADGDSGTP